MLSQLTVGWLLLLAAGLIFAGGFGVRVIVGRKRDVVAVRRAVRGLRNNVIGRVLFGPVTGDAVDDEELDQMIVMPSIVLSSGLALTAIFLLGIAVLA